MANIVNKELHSQNNLRKVNFGFAGTLPNPAYKDGLITLPLRSCHIRNNATSGYGEETYQIKTQPKYTTYLSYDEIDAETGELVTFGNYLQTDELKRANSRKIGRLDDFCDYYQPKYQSREISLMFHTFTRFNHANCTFRDMMHYMKYHYKEIGKPIRGFVWTLEVAIGEDGSVHPHYHAGVAIDRMNISGSGMPGHLKLEQAWGQRTGIEFAQKNIKYYMSKYFSKHNARVMKMRSYGSSRKFV